MRHIGFVSFRLYRKVSPDLLRRFGEESLSEAIPIFYAKIQTHDPTYRSAEGWPHRGRDCLWQSPDRWWDDLAYRDQHGKPKPVKFVSYIWKRIDGHIIDGVKRELEREKLFRTLVDS